LLDFCRQVTPAYPTKPGSAVGKRRELLNAKYR